MNGKRTKTHDEANVGCAHMTPTGGNVFADIGFEPREATSLKANSDRIISTKLRIKKLLAAELSSWMEEHHINPDDAATTLGVSHSVVSEAMLQNVQQLTIDALVGMVVRTGKQVQLSID